jgi:hypothetical protein
VIVIYHDDDVQAAPVASLLIEKGVDNVFVLSGGLKRFAEVHPDRLSADLPPRLLQQTPPSSSSKKGPGGGAHSSFRNNGNNSSFRSGRPGTAETDTQSMRSYGGESLAQIFSRLAPNAKGAASVATKSVRSRKDGPPSEPVWRPIANA